MKKIFLLILFFISSVFGIEIPAAPPENKTTNTKLEPWKSSVPPEAQDSKKWIKLLSILDQQKLYYGKLAAASRMLIFFNDIDTKQKAYEAIVEIIDEGYPYDLSNLFVSGDLEPDGSYWFNNSYYLYKALSVKDDINDKWKKSYLEQIDPKFKKLVFYNAQENYKNKNLKKSIELLEEILASKETLPLSLIHHSARTLARILFELQRYNDAADIYLHFLLGLNPVHCNDYLEAAWSLYYLKQYSQALGMLYNLESKACSEQINLEQYELRALIYQQNCDIQAMDKLNVSFNDRFNRSILGIKLGIEFNKLLQLNNIYVSENEKYYQSFKNVEELEDELKRMIMPIHFKPLAYYLYLSEIAFWKREKASLTEDALNRSASYLVNFSEKLKFIKFDLDKAAKEDLDEDLADEKKQKKKSLQLEENFIIPWIQVGDYWRDERTHFRGLIKNQCGI